MPRLTVPVTEQDHTLGTITAPVTLVEYGDYQCQTCRMSAPILKHLKNELGQKLCIVFRHFPLQQAHALAKSAAEVAEAASMQGRFWEMHELLFKNQFSLGPHLFKELAEQLHLNLVEFETDLHSAKVAQKIEADFSNGIRSGVNGTPCFYINGERYDGDSSYEGFKQALIQASLAQK